MRSPATEGIGTPDAKYQAIEALVRRGYAPQPLRRISIPKKNGKLRPLGIPCMIDRAQQALHLLALAPIAETKADPHSYGFRSERSTADAIEQCFNVLSNRRAPEWILEGDIEGCFDNISHDWLVAHVPMDKVVLRKWLKAGYIENRQLFPTAAGTPQGGIISPALSSQIWRALWRWCCRRHPNKPKGWIKHRYFHCTDGRSWTFAAARDIHQSDRKPLMMALRRTSDIPIRRHTKIKSEANSFDPAWETYFEDRIGLKMFNTLAGRKKLIRLWFDQQGECIVCGQRITKETGWHVHHIVRRIDGGNNAVQNVVMVHPTCHSQIHSLGLKVTKPVSAKGL